MPRPESEFPTLRDVRDRLSELIDKGLGDLPAQVLVVPDSTLQAIAGASSGRKPAIMIDLGGGDGRMPVGLVCADRLASMPTSADALKTPTRLWVCANHVTHWPVGAASIVMADSEGDARALLDAALRERGLDPGDGGYTLLELNTSIPFARVLCDGQY